MLFLLKSICLDDNKKKNTQFLKKRIFDRSQKRALIIPGHLNCGFRNQFFQTLFRQVKNEVDLKARAQLKSSNLRLKIAKAQFG